jgi:hypothetical protein
MEWGVRIPRLSEIDSWPDPRARSPHPNSLMNRWGIGARGRRRARPPQPRVWMSGVSRYE